MNLETFGDPKNWLISRPHLLLLSKFEHGRLIEDIPSPKEGWHTALKEDPRDAIHRFIKDEAIMELSLEQKIRLTHDIPQLKSLLRLKKQKLAGKKNELIQRLIECDEANMRFVMESQKFYGLTEIGELLIDEFKSFCKKELIDTQNGIIGSLKNNDFLGASRYKFEYEEAQVNFGRGFALPKQYWKPERYAANLMEIMNTTSFILENLPKEEIVLFQITACFLDLSFPTPEWVFPADFNPEIKIKDKTWAARSILYTLNFKQELETLQARRKEYLEFSNEYGLISDISTYEYVAILTANDQSVCKPCKELSSKRYKLENLPSLPYKNCTCVLGCRCLIVNSEHY